MQNEMTLREWVERFNKGEFDSRDYYTQTKAGWYDWFCRDTSLANKTKKMGNIVKKIQDGGKVDLDNNYVWFKNNCPLVGPLYDDFRIADIKTGDTLLTVQIACPHSDFRYVVYGGKNKFQEPLFKCNSSRDIVNWLNEGWE